MVHARHGVAGAVLDALDHGADLVGGLAGALGQLAHFVGHHGKTAARFAGPGGFDGGVEGQQIGLVGDFLDGIDDRGDLAGLRPQAFHLLGRIPHLGGQGAHLVDGLEDDAFAVGG
ncbi:hypothetical protein SDC9_166227 [bioreactor metagenome]|uniref:Uncharacterized protein n=1 Tax=bioreactor metagenome TaxID=1076179 RepID=A0A645FYS1_9ZZZZ